MVTPESMVGVSEKMVSVATSSDRLGILNAGNLDLKCFLIGYLVEATAHWVVLWKVFSMVCLLN